MGNRNHSKYIFGLLIVLLMAAACVPNRKITYLQQGEELKEREDIVTDQVVRTHPMVIQEYKIQPLDILLIRFETITQEEYDFFKRIDPQQGAGGGNQQNQINNGIVVDAEGYIEYPVLGRIKLSGLTMFEAQKVLQDKAQPFLPDNVARVRPLNFRFSVVGEVNRPQVVTSQNTRVTMMEAVAMAGDFGELADRSIVKIIRQKGDQSEVHYVNLLEEDFIESDFYYVHQNDIIVVPPLKQRTFRKYFTSNLGIWTATVTAVLLAVSLFTR
ncbi:polysaccharide biosynthesis/export family protein [Fulvivirga sedimenti]|uniref:Polysaccharide biosynthesis/export family protein n=1 Tax=Fulvivirga sedimenti TaxID=2879465 RepID=A0A9X1HLD8_9BACT|nr:polysaccharide biosynthesis/export family protein [Fulvivirga sedimenti]MCA6073436.1 polysaccharide biosynthesis/export family protein [Fulvivirga sedimenti]